MSDRRIADIVALDDALLTSSSDGALDLWTKKGDRIRRIVEPDDMAACRIIHANATRICLWGWENVVAVRTATGEIDEWGAWELQGHHGLDEDLGECAAQDGLAILPDGAVVSLETGELAYPSDDGWDTPNAVSTDAHGILCAFDRDMLRLRRDGLESVARLDEPIRGIAVGGTACSLASGRIVTLPERCVRESPVALPSFYVSRLAHLGRSVVHVAEFRSLDGRGIESALIAWDDEHVALTQIEKMNDPYSPAGCIACGARTIVAGIRGCVVRVGEALERIELGAVPTAAWTDDERVAVGTSDGRLLFLASS